MHKRNQCLDAVVDWMSANKLKLNPIKRLYVSGSKVLALPWPDNYWHTEAKFFILVAPLL